MSKIKFKHFARADQLAMITEAEAGNCTFVVVHRKFQNGSSSVCLVAAMSSTEYVSVKKFFKRLYKEKNVKIFIIKEAKNFLPVSEV